MDLSYFNSRVRGLRGRLLRAASYDVLFKSSGADGYIADLMPTEYGPYLESASAAVGADPSETLSYALRQNLADTFRTIWKEAPPEARPYIKALFSSWEVYNLKAVIRGIVKNVRRGDIIEVTVPAGEFDGAAIKTLLAAKDVRDVARYLSTWGSPYARALKEGLDMYQRTGSAVELELRLDLAAIAAYAQRFCGGASIDKRIMSEILCYRADAVNLLTVIKVAGEGYSKDGAASLYGALGRALDKETFVEIASMSNRDDAIKVLAGAVKDARFRKIAPMIEAYDADAIEEALDDALERRLRRLSVVEPLSIALGAAYMYEKVREIKNLRLIARSRAFGIPRESLAGYLFYR